MTTTHPILTFDNRAAAQAYIAELDGTVYHLAHGEYARPEYSARKVRGQDRYYIHASYHYYPGTFYANQNGPLADY